MSQANIKLSKISKIVYKCLFEFFRHLQKKNWFFHLFQIISWKLQIDLQSWNSTLKPLKIDVNASNLLFSVIASSNWLEFDSETLKIDLKDSNLLISAIIDWNCNIFSFKLNCKVGSRLSSFENWLGSFKLVLLLTKIAAFLKITWKAEIWLWNFESLKASNLAFQCYYWQIAAFLD